MGFPLRVRDVVTPTAAILVLVSGVTGIALLLHWNAGLFHFAHEWLGVAFVAAAGWHVVRKGRAVVGYLARPASIFVLALCAVASVAFTVATASPPRAGSPVAVARALAAAPIASVAPAFGLRVDEAVAILAGRGIEASGTDTLETAARRAGVSSIELATALASAAHLPR